MIVGVKSNGGTVPFHNVNMGNDVFNLIDRIDESIKEEEGISNTTIEYLTFNLEIPPLKKSALTFLRERLGLEIKGTKNKHEIQFNAAPDELYTYLLAVFSTIKAGERVAVKESNSEVYQKTVAKDTARNGSLREGCPLIKKVAEVNGTTPEMTFRVMERWPRDYRRDILMAAYQDLYGEALGEKAKNVMEKLEKTAMNHFLTDTATATTVPDVTFTWRER